jgi:hypothetical protein
MIDGPEHLAHWPELREPLEACAVIVRPTYHEVDAAAIRHQGRHRRYSNAAILFGTLAVLLAIIQLAFPDWVEAHGIRGVPTWEIVATALAVIAVLAAILSAAKANWMVERHKAERLRLAKFRFLTDPETWCGPQELEQQINRLRDGVAQIRTMGSEAFRQWVGELQRAEALLPPPPRPCPIGAGAFGQLVDYYRAKRVVYQRLYFRDRSHRNVPMAWLTGWLAPLLLFASVICVLGHYALDLSGRDPLSHEEARVFIFLAAALPAVSASVRAIRETHQFARNRVRYNAKELNLLYLEDALKGPGPVDQKFRAMEFCEGTLKLEHREWARLMLDTEFLP